MWKKSLLSKEKRKALREMGWRWHKFYISKPLKEKEITIEFCIGDNCVGIYDKYKSLLEPKYRADNFIEALVKATEFEANYA